MNSVIFGFYLIASIHSRHESWLVRGLLGVCFFDTFLLKSVSRRIENKEQVEILCVELLKISIKWN